MLLISATYVNAQEIGIRAGAFHGGGYWAIDGVVPLDQGRIHADLTFDNWGVGFDALWDVIYKDLKIETETFQWYLGAGAGTYFVKKDFGLGALAEVGIEYQFTEAPIVLGIDWRPGLLIIPDTYLHVLSFGLNARWVF